MLSNKTNSKVIQPKGKILGSRKSKMAASNLEIACTQDNIKTKVYANVFGVQLSNGTIVAMPHKNAVNPEVVNIRWRPVTGNGCGIRYI